MSSQMPRLIKHSQSEYRLLSKSELQGALEESKVTIPRVKQTISDTQDRSGYYSNVDYMLDLSKFVPSLVVQKLMKEYQNNQTPARLPDLQQMETVVIFADISGYTNLSEACIKKGETGNEELAFCINRYMEGMVQNLDMYGGDIIKFVGDAMIVMWPQIDKNCPKYQDQRVDTIRRAIQCSLDIQKQMNNLMVLPGVTLSVKIGIGYGECALLYVGGVFNRAETLTVGAALMDALKSEGQGIGGQVIVAESCFSHVADFEYYQTDEIIDSVTNEKFYKLKPQQKCNKVKIQAEMMKLRSQFSYENLYQIRQKLESCVAFTLIPFLSAHQDKFASQNRSLTVMFISLGIDLSQASSQEGLGKIQEVMVLVQKQVYRFQGAINKLVMDDKGSTMICIWGLQPFAHDDDAARAIQTGFNIIEELSKNKGITCNIGVSSGECFSGLVGTSGSRKEFSVMGDIVNLSARIMGSMKNLTNQIKCDLNTRMLAANFFEFNYQKHVELKGKSISIPFFKPVPQERKTKMVLEKVLPPEIYLQRHQSPMILGREPERLTKYETVGYETIGPQLTKRMISYFMGDLTTKAQVTLIKGPMGQGKTTFMRHILNLFAQMPQLKSYRDYNKQKLPIYASAANHETQLQFMKVWHPIYQMMLVRYCKKFSKKKEDFIADLIIEKDCCELSDIIIEFTGTQKNFIQKSKIELINSIADVEPKHFEDQFVRVQDYKEQHKQKLIEFLTELFLHINDNQHALSEMESQSSSELEDKQSLQQETKNDNDIEDQGLMQDPNIICIDNAIHMDPTSWILLDSLLRCSKHVSIFLLLKTDYKDRIMIPEQSVNAFEQAWHNIFKEQEILFQQIDLSPLTVHEIHILILLHAPLYRSSFKKELQDMTKILDPTNTIKTEEQGQQWLDYYTEKWQLTYQIKSIDQRVIQVVHHKCEGNPILGLQFFVSMVQNGFVLVDSSGSVTPTPDFERCDLINDWSALPVPRLSYKLNLQILSNFVGMNARSKTQTVAIILLSVASIIGNTFTLRVLKEISPLPKDQFHDQRVYDAIRWLEQQDVIEIVDQTNSQNLKCRFNKPFMRETIYQMLLYKSVKRPIHGEIEKYASTAKTLKLQNSLVVKERLMLHMLRAQDCKHESQLSHERRKALTVIQIQAQQLENPNGIIFKEFQFKRATNKLKLDRSLQERLLVLSKDKFEWYHDQQEFDNGSAIGQISLLQIQSINKIKRESASENPTFELQVSNWINRHQVLQGQSSIRFGCKTDLDRDRWMAGIDYLKTKAIFDTYSRNNSLVNLVFEKEQESNIQTDQQERQQSSEIAQNFGQNMRQQLTQSFARQKYFANKPINMQHARISNTFTDHNQVQELVTKLKVLYQFAMTSFLHQTKELSLKQSSTIKIVRQKHQDEEVEHMKFPANKFLTLHRLIRMHARTGNLGRTYHDSQAEEIQTLHHTSLSLSSQSPQKRKFTYLRKITEKHEETKQATNQEPIETNFAAASFELGSQSLQPLQSEQKKRSSNQSYQSLTSKDFVIVNRQDGHNRSTSHLQSDNDKSSSKYKNQKTDYLISLVKTQQQQIQQILQEQKNVSRFMSHQMMSQSQPNMIDTSKNVSNSQIIDQDDQSWLQPKFLSDDECIPPDDDDLDFSCLAKNLPDELEVNFTTDRLPEMEQFNSVENRMSKYKDKRVKAQSNAARKDQMYQTQQILRSIDLRSSQRASQQSVQENKSSIQRQQF